MAKSTMRHFRVAAGCLIAFGIARVVYAEFTEVGEYLRKSDWALIVLAFSLCCLYRLLNAAGWGMVLRSLGHPIPAMQSIQLWLKAETMRWLPGSIWGYCSRVNLAQKTGVPLIPATLSMPLELLITVAAWSCAVLLGGTDLFRHMQSRFPGSTLSYVAVVAGGLVVLAVIAAGIMVKAPNSRSAKKVREFAAKLKQLRNASPAVKPLVGSFVWFSFLGVLNGLIFYLLLRAFIPAQLPLLSIIAINALGWLTGFFAVFSPGGLGVREGCMSGLLATMIPLEIAVIAVVAWRLLQVLAEVACLAVCLLPSPKTMSLSPAPLAHR